MLALLLRLSGHFIQIFQPEYLSIYCLIFFFFKSLITIHYCCCCQAKSCLTLLWPHRLQTTRLLCHGISQSRIPEWVAISFSNNPLLFARDLTLLMSFEVLMSLNLGPKYISCIILCFVSSNSLNLDFRKSHPLLWNLTIVDIFEEFRPIVLQTTSFWACLIVSSCSDPDWALFCFVFWQEYPPNGIVYFQLHHIRRYVSFCPIICLVTVLSAKSSPL